MQLRVVLGRGSHAEHAEGDTGDEFSQSFSMVGFDDEPACVWIEVDPQETIGAIKDRVCQQTENQPPDDYDFVYQQHQLLNNHTLTDYAILDVSIIHTLELRAVPQIQWHNAASGEISPRELEGRPGATLDYSQSIAQRRALVLLDGLLRYAAESGQSFSNGTFVLHDPEQRAWKSLELVGYLRLSSHLTQLPADCQCYWSNSGNMAVIQQGIDFDDYEWSAPNQSAGEPDVEVTFRTVLFYQLLIHGEHFLFLKPEDNGLGSLHTALSHGVDLLFSKIVGHKDAGVKRKERVDPSIQRLFEHTAKELKIDPEITTRAKAAGVYARRVERLLPVHKVPLASLLHCVLCCLSHQCTPGCSTALSAA